MSHVARRDNIADCLSRLCENASRNNNDGMEVHEYVKFAAQTSSLTALQTKKIEQATANDVTLQNILRCVTTNVWL